MTSTQEPIFQERMLGLAVAKGWLRAEQVAGRALPELVAEGLLLPIQVEALEGEMRTGRAEVSGALATGEEPTYLGPDKGGTGAEPATQPPARHDSSIFQASWIRYWGHFEDLVLLAEGGMGRVFKARDMRLGRKVALKLLRRDDPELERRLVQEAELQARVTHPHVCTIYESGYWNGQAYIAMELVEGETFAVMKSQWDLPTKLALMAQVCEGVHAAHRQGLVHRDLKPANLMAVKGEDGWRAVVMDFGLARPAQGTGLTQTGIVMGTVAYMSPEQARGQDWKLDRRTDVYALGASLYELVGGRTPFHGSAGLEAVTRILSEDPAPLPGASRDLNTVILKCLEKEPVQRYDSARALGDELLRVVEGDPILARPHSASERLGRWSRKNKTLVAVGAVGLLATLTLGAFAARERILATRRALYAQRFGQEAERIEALARYIRLQPPHSQEQDWQDMRRRVDRLSQAVTEAGATGAAPGWYALGRAASALGDAQSARSNLERAWALGFHDPAVAQALGQALTLLYEKHLAEAGATGDPALKAARIREATRLFGRPAADYLRMGGAATLDPPAYHAARLALLEGRLDEALIQGEAAIRQAPWHYESHALLARIWLQKARASFDSAEARTCLIHVSSWLGRAMEIGRSDRGLLDVAFQRWQEEIALGWRSSSDPKEAVEAQLALADQLRVLEPSGMTASIWEGRACGEEARYLTYSGQDSRAWIERAKQASEQAYVRRPGDADACAALASALRTTGLRMVLRGEGDPEPDLRRGLEVAGKGLQADPGSVFLWNLRTACAAVLIDHRVKQRSRGDVTFLDEVLRDARKEAEDHADLAYFQANLGTLLLGSAELASAQGREASGFALEARRANERAAELDPKHLGIRRGILLAIAQQAKAVAVRGGDPSFLAAEAVQALRNARTIGLQAPELEVPVLDVQLLRLEFLAARREPVLADAMELSSRLKSVPGFPIAPEYLDQQRKRANLLLAKLRHAPAGAAARRSPAVRGDGPGPVS